MSEGPSPSDERVTREAWRALDARLRPFVARRVRPEDVDDVLQDIFVRMQRSLDDLRDEERFGPWVHRIARSAIVDHLRRAARHPRSDAQAPEEADPPSDVEDEGAAERELARYIAAFVAMLPSPYREALTLTELEGLTQKEAAELLGVSHSGMKSRVQRGRRELKRALEGCCHIALDARGRVLAYERREGGCPPDRCCQ